MLEGQRISRINEIGIKIQMAFRMLQKELRDYQVKVTEIELDLNQVEMEKIEASTKELLEEQMLQDAVSAILRLMQAGKTTEEILGYVKTQEVYAKFKEKHIVLLEERDVDKKIVSHIEELLEADEESGGSPAIVGSDSLEWPFEGDYWEDEIWGYRSFLGEECN